MTKKWNAEINDFIIKGEDFVSEVKDVEPTEDFCLKIFFVNGEIKIFDCKKYFQYEIYRNLQNPVFFKKAHVECGTVVWDDNTDFAPECLYEESVNF